MSSLRGVRAFQYRRLPESAAPAVRIRVEVQAKYYKAVVSKDVVKRILEWQNDPLNPAKALPDAWRCEGSPSIYPDWQYTVKDEVRARRRPSSISSPRRRRTR